MQGAFSKGEGAIALGKKKGRGVNAQGRKLSPLAMG